MERPEHDVYLSYRAESAADFARTISNGLAARGFRLVTARSADATVDPVNQAIEDVPDFVLLLTPGCLDVSNPADPFIREIARAIETRRNIVPVSVNRDVLPESLPPQLEPLRLRPLVYFNGNREAESLALIAHRLSSEASINERHVLRGWKRLGAVAALLLTAAVALALARTLPGMVGRYRASRPLPPMVLYWGSFGQRLVSGAWLEVPVKDGDIAPGDEIRLMFSPSADGYAYVMAQDGSGDVSALFPGRALKGASRVNAGRMYTAPADGGWWATDDGMQPARICIVASYDPIENLESLVDEREDFTPAARKALFESTLEGLIDGKHEPDGLRARTRAGRLILRSIEVHPTLTTASTTLVGGAIATHPLVEERGRLTALVEIKLGTAK